MKFPYLGIWSISSILVLFSLIWMVSCKSSKEAGKESNGFPVLKHHAEITWVHSHEEDQGEQRFYRHEPFQFPPARGREGFKLETESDLVYFAIGPDDRPRELEGTWSYSKGVLHLNVIGADMVDSFERAYKVVKSEPDLLVLEFVAIK